MAPGNRPDYHLNLEGLPQLNMQSRSANTSQANSPIEPPAGSGHRYPLGNGLGSSSNQAGTGRTGSPSKEYGSRLFPKRYVLRKRAALAMGRTDL
jgi:protein JSN1